MCGKIIKKIHNLHVKADPIFGKYLDSIPKSLGMPTVGEFADGLGGADAAKETGAAAAASASGTSTAATTSSDSVQSAVEAERRRRLAQSGQGSTILTGASGVLGNASTGQKTLLGV